MNRQIAHNIDNKSRTEDVKTVDNVDFSAMLLSDAVMQGLLANGFKKPSPIQLKAIPMGRCGYDLILQAKSGTGKTAVFGIIALEMIDVTKNNIQVLMIAPTREIAVQIKDVIEGIGMNFKGLKVEYFIGGLNFDEDLKKLKNCHIAVGAPGRIKHLVKDGNMNLDSVKLFVLDEADKIIGTGQQKDINFIYTKLPSTKQMIASSATYPGNLKKFLHKYMSTPTVVDSQNDVPTLLGIRQFITTVPSHLNVVQQMNLKIQELIRILQIVSFNQCIVFCNYQTRAETLSNNLSRQGWPTTYISAAQNQKSRLEAVNSLKDFKCRILCTTDLTARGIDAANVDLVVNYEIPIDSETYLHRMGRAGRYGSSGLCISIATETDIEKLQKLLGNISNSITVMKFPKENFSEDIWTCDVEVFDKIHAIVDSKTDQICDTMKELSVQNNKIKEDPDKNDTVTVESLLENLKKNNELSDMNTATSSDHIPTINIKKEIMDDTGNSSEINIEEMLLTLNKQEEDTKNELKHKLNIKQEIMDDTENSSELNVEQLLSTLNKQEEETKNELKHKFKNLNASTLLDLITNDKLEDTSTTSEDSDTKLKSKCKKAKRNKKSKSSTEDSESNEKFENEAILFQKNSIVHKNTALYNLTKIIVQQDPITNDSVTSTESLLNIMKQEDNIELKQQKSKLKFDDLLNNLGLLTDNAPVIGKWEVVRTITPTNNEKCTCPNNLFNKVFDFALSKNDNHWLNTLCEMHQNIEPEKTVEEEEEVVNMDEDSYDNFYEENYDDYEVESADMEDEELYIFDDDVFVKAYDYALRSQVREIEQSPENTNTENTTENYYGYAASYNYEHLQSPKRKRETNKNNKLEDYESYFEYYNKMLLQNATNFSDVQEFEEWFSKWQQSVTDIRNYMQEEIYQQQKRNK